MAHPERFAGFHFFNPVPLMKVVEVVAGFKTRPRSASSWPAMRPRWASAVQAQDTPGFIVNHAGRGHGTEALRIVGEGIADFADHRPHPPRTRRASASGPSSCWTSPALDVSHPVMESIYRQYYEERAAARA